MGEDVGAIGGGDGCGEGFDEGGALGLREVFGLGWHLAFFDAVVDADPAVAGGGVGEIEGERGEVEAAFGGVLVVAFDAALLDLRRGSLGVRKAGGENEGSERAEKVPGTSLGSAGTGGRHGGDGGAEVYKARGVFLSGGGFSSRTRMYLKCTRGEDD